MGELEVQELSPDQLLVGRLAKKTREWEMLICLEFTMGIQMPKKIKEDVEFTINSGNWDCFDDGGLGDCPKTLGQYLCRIYNG